MKITTKFPFISFNSEPVKSELQELPDVAEKNAIPVTITPAPAPAKKISKIAQKVLDDLDKYPINEWFINEGKEKTLHYSSVKYILIHWDAYCGPESYSVKGLNLKEVDIKGITNKIQSQKFEMAAKQREKECAETLEKMGFKLEEAKEELAYI